MYSVAIAVVSALTSFLHRSPTDRRPIDPPPIIQLHIGGSSADSWHFFRTPITSCLCRPRIALAPDRRLRCTQRAPTRFTTGAVVSSLHILKDPENGQRRGGFFVFPDLGVRAEGKYRLKCTLYEVVESTAANWYTETNIFSSVFEVYQSRKFPGMQKQGIKIWIRRMCESVACLPSIAPPGSWRRRFPKPHGKRARVDQEEDVKKKTERIDKSERHTPMLESPSVLYVAPPTPSIAIRCFHLDMRLLHPPPTSARSGQGRSRMSIGNLLNAADPPRLESR
ncbi:velvet factor-domain-containing protein [Mucidula mucida]|nr:velvet factor-domain-containing protein [Mucidula mucida]